MSSKGGCCHRLVKRIKKCCHRIHRFCQIMGSCQRILLVLTEGFDPWVSQRMILKYIFFEAIVSLAIAAFFFFNSPIGELGVLGNWAGYFALMVMRATSDLTVGLYGSCMRKVSSTKFFVYGQVLFFATTIFCGLPVWRCRCECNGDFDMVLTKYSDIVAGTSHYKSLTHDEWQCLVFIGFGFSGEYVSMDRGIRAYVKQSEAELKNGTSFKDLEWKGHFMKWYNTTPNIGWKSEAVRDGKDCDILEPKNKEEVQAARKRIHEMRDASNTKGENWEPGMQGKKYPWQRLLKNRLIHCITLQEYFCGAVSIELTQDGEPSDRDKDKIPGQTKITICEHRLPVVPLRLPEADYYDKECHQGSLQGSLCLSKKGCIIGSKGLCTAKEGSAYFQSNIVLSFNNMVEDLYMQENSRNRCGFTKMAVIFVMFVLNGVSVLVSPMLVKFLKWRCGDYIAEESQFEVEFESDESDCDEASPHGGTGRSFESSEGRKSQGSPKGRKSRKTRKTVETRESGSMEMTQRSDQGQSSAADPWLGSGGVGGLFGGTGDVETPAESDPAPPKTNYEW